MTTEELKKGAKAKNTFTSETGLITGLGKAQVKIENDNGTKTQCAIWFALKVYIIIHN